MDKKSRVRRQWGNRRTLPQRLEAHFGDRVIACYRGRPGNLNQFIADAVLRNPEGEALVFGQARLTWRELDLQIGRVTMGLKSNGLQRGDRVALLLRNRPEFIVLFFAVLRLGAVVVPLNTREQKPELEYVLNHSEAKLLVYEKNIEERLPDPERTPSLIHRISLGTANGPDSYASALLCGNVCTEAVPVDEEDTAAIMYTSGTTGRPKGAMLSHLGIMHSAMSYCFCMNLSAVDRSIAAVPLSHVTGVVALMATMAYCRGTLVLMDEFKAAEFLALAARERITHSLLVPAMYNLLLLHQDFSQHDLSAWRVGGYGGAPMPLATVTALATKLPRLGLMNIYGATEATSPATIMPPEQTLAHIDSVGLALPCAEILIMDEEGHALPSGSTGEVWIKGPMVVRGYWNDPAATATEFIGGYWRSGDIGFMDEGGYLRVLDRKKDLINRGGYKIYSAEVESVITEHSGVIEAALVSVPCPVLGERAYAFVTVLDPGISPDDLKKFCAERLSDYKVPEDFIISASLLPRNANGKLLKRELRSRAEKLWSQ